jgi:hypothetical protein
MLDIFQAAGLPPPAVLDTPDALRILVTGLRPRNPSASRGAQARDVFEQMERALLRRWAATSPRWPAPGSISMTSWTWYGEFNAVRTKFFGERGVFQGNRAGQHGRRASPGLGSAPWPPRCWPCRRGLRRQV